MPIRLKNWAPDPCLSRHLSTKKVMSSHFRMLIVPPEMAPSLKKPSPDSRTLLLNAAMFYTTTLLHNRAVSGGILRIRAIPSHE